jgi:hypothetical protein
VKYAIEMGSSAMIYTSKFDKNVFRHSEFDGVGMHIYIA